MIKQSQLMHLAVTPDLRHIQLDSFRHLLNHLVPFELSRIINYRTPFLSVRLLGTSYRFSFPNCTPQEAVDQALSYTSTLYLPVSVTNEEEGWVEIQTVCLGNWPLMTRHGNFILNGISRCLVSQLVRSPGVYYTLNNEGQYLATLLGDSGKRLKLKLNSDNIISVIFQNNVTFPLLTLLLACGVDLKYIPDVLKPPIYFTNSADTSLPSSIEEAFKYVNNLLKPNITRLKAGDSLEQLILNDYALGTIGRLQFNDRLGLDAMDANLTLTVEDLIIAALYLFQVADGQAALDDIDDLKYKRVKRVAEIFQEQLHSSLTILGKKIQQTLQKRALNKRLLSPGYFLYVTPLNLERFLTAYELSQFLDQTNPLAEVVHKRKVSALGPGGLTARTARFRVRDIHPSQYGRICPIETAEGEKAGIVTALTAAAHIDVKGRIANVVYAIQSPSMKGYQTNLLANIDEYARIATGRMLDLLWTPVQHRREFTSLSWEDINYRSLLPLHFFSVGVGLIPFLEHDDSTRALMGSNMQRQAVTLLHPERPIVGTGMEGHIGADASTVVTSEFTGAIHYVDHQTIILRDTLSTEWHQLNLLPYARLNNNIGIEQRPVVEAQNYIQSGQLLADSNATVGGEIALGKNVLVAYMPWEGYNFEDAILLSERLVQDQVYTSLHIERYDTDARITNDFSEVFTKDIPHLSDYVLRHLDNQGLVNIGQWVEPGDVLVGKLIINPSDAALYGPESRLLQEIFGIEAITTQEKCLKVPLRGAGRVIDVRSFTSENHAFGTIHTVHVYVLQARPIKIGDKLAGRHGNKGVVSKIVPREDMPYLADGTPVDMVLSPLGVPSRMNVGQIFECLLGFSGYLLDKQYRVFPFDERYETQASRKLVLSELYAASRVSSSPWCFEINTPGKMHLFDGRTGERFEQTVSAGRAYMFKLVHQVDDKLHARSTGPYAIITQQPLRGKSRQGGQRVGEMEVWAFQGFGAAYALQELLTLKSDHIEGRSQAIKAMVNGKAVPFFTTSSDCLRAFMRELRSLGLNIEQKSISEFTGYAYDKPL